MYFNNKIFIIIIIGIIIYTFAYNMHSINITEYLTDIAINNKNCQESPTTTLANNIATLEKQYDMLVFKIASLSKRIDVYDEFKRKFDSHMNAELKR